MRVANRNRRTRSTILTEPLALTSERIAPETVAAFLDGTLPASDRERLLRELALGGAAYEDLIEAQALKDAGDTATQTTPTPAPAPSPLTSGPANPPAPDAASWSRRRNMWGMGSLLAAAGIAAILFVQRSNGSPGASLASVAVQRVTAAAEGADLDARFGVGWERVNWSATRGAVESLDERVHSFRMGVRFVDFSLALSSRDTEMRRSLSEALAALASSVTGGPAVAARIEELAADSTGRSRPAKLRVVSDDLRALTSEPAWYDAAVWTESARLAARGGQAAFFANGDAPMHELGRIIDELAAAKPPVTGESDDLVQPLRHVAEQRIATPADLPLIAPLLDSTVARNGRSIR
jgi:hypothetical protein